MVLMRVHRSESNEELEGEDKTEHWDLGNVIGSHPQNPVHKPTTVDECRVHPEEYLRCVGRCCCRLG